jgi:hypothetical protein
MLHHSANYPSSSQHPAPALLAPATEVVFINNPFPDFLSSLAEFNNRLLSKSAGQTGGFAVGPITEELGGVKRLYLVVGWESVAHQRGMMATEEFKDCVGLVRDHCESLALDYVEFVSAS